MVFSYKALIKEERVNPNPSESPEAKANRLIQLRTLAKLSRKDVAQMANIAFSTYKGWENGRFGGIPQKRAVLLINAYQNEGISSSASWLMSGAGEPPEKLRHHQIKHLKDAITAPASISFENMEELKIKAELEFFCNNNKWETISITVPDDAMTPYFFQEDLVAGIKIPQENFTAAIGLNCLVRTKGNKILLRLVQEGCKENHFTLLCSNTNTKTQFVLHNVELIDIAPVTWVRRKITSLIKTLHKK